MQIIFTASSFTASATYHGRHGWRRAFAAVLGVAVLTVVGACSSTIPEVVGPTVKIGVPFDRPGLSVSRSGVMSGFNIDIAKSVAYDLGYSERQIEWVEITDQTEDQLFTTGDIDMAVGVTQYSQVSSGTHSVEFAGPYLSAPMGMLVRSQDAKKIQNSSDLDGKNICTVSGESPDDKTTADVSSFIKRASHVFEQQIYSQCMSALATTTVDAVVGNSVILEQFVFRMSGQSYSMNILPEFTMSYGIAVPSGDKRLYAKIQSRLAQIAKNGDWNRMFAEIKDSSTHKEIKNLRAPNIVQPPDEQ